MSEYQVDGPVAELPPTPDPAPEPQPPAATYSTISPRVILATVIAAALGAAGWMLMVVTTKHEIGFAAVFLGILCARLISDASGRRRGFGLVALALVAFVAALAIGKYGAFAYFLQQVAQDRFGADVASHYGYLSQNTWEMFRADPSIVFDAFDVLWIGIGALSIWRRLAPALA